MIVEKCVLFGLFWGSLNSISLQNTVIYFTKTCYMYIYNVNDIQMSMKLYCGKDKSTMEHVQPSHRNIKSVNNYIKEARFDFRNSLISFQLKLTYKTKYSQTHNRLNTFVLFSANSTIGCQNILPVFEIKKEILIAHIRSKAKKETSHCLTGPCCDLLTSTYHGPTTLCRSAKDCCDVPEYCSGYSFECPVDEHIQNGVDCGDNGTCHNGLCHSFPAICRRIHPLLRPPTKTCIALVAKRYDSTDCKYPVACQVPSNLQPHPQWMVIEDSWGLCLDVTPTSLGVFYCNYEPPPKPVCGHCLEKTCTKNGRCLSTPKMCHSKLNITSSFIPWTLLLFFSTTVLGGIIIFVGMRLNYRQFERCLIKEQIASMPSWSNNSLTDASNDISDFSNVYETTKIEDEMLEDDLITVINEKSKIEDDMFEDNLIPNSDVIDY